jgi:Flp pilus assembly pilin Flp
MKNLKNVKSTKRGAALVEYALIVAGVALVSLVAVAVFGGKVGKLMGVSAAVVPGATEDDNGTIVSGKVARVSNDGGVITLDPGTENNLANNLGIDNMGDLVQDPTVDGGG